MGREIFSATFAPTEGRWNIFSCTREQKRKEKQIDKPARNPTHQILAYHKASFQELKYETADLTKICNLTKISLHTGGLENSQ